jgi:hypothetical protein
MDFTSFLRIFMDFECSGARLEARMLDAGRIGWIGGRWLQDFGSSYLGLLALLAGPAADQSCQGSSLFDRLRSDLPSLA